MLFADATIIVFDTARFKSPESTTFTILNTSETGNSILSPTVLVGVESKN